MKNFWLERAEEKAMTMEERIEKMLAPHHMIWLVDDKVGQTGAVMPDVIYGDIPSHITITDEIPAGITVTWTQPQMAEWDVNTTIVAPTNPHSDLSYTCFDINAFNAEIRVEIEQAVDAEFARLVESEGWNLDL